MSGAFDVMASVADKERLVWTPGMLRDWLSGWIQGMEEDREVFGLTPAEEANVTMAKAKLATLEAGSSPQTANRSPQSGGSDAS